MYKVQDIFNVRPFAPAQQKVVDVNDLFISKNEMQTILKRINLLSLLNAPDALATINHLSSRALEIAGVQDVTN